MVEVLDEEGNLFGVINVVDALVVLLVATVLIAGVSLVLSSQNPSDGTGTDNTVLTVEYRSENLQPYVVDAITEGAVTSGNVTRITDKSVTPSQVITQDQSGDLFVQQHPTRQTITLRLGLNVTVQDSEYLYNGKPVYIGTKLTLDLGKTTVSGEVIAIEPSDSS